MRNLTTSNLFALSVGLAAAAFAGPAHADKSTPDWPCVQKKVAELSPSQMWTGPSIEGLKGWWEDKEATALINIMASRKVPTAEAEAAIKKYAEGLPADQRNAKLTLLFAGLFDKINLQRRVVITGLEKYLSGQRERSQDIETQGTALAELEAKVAKDPADQQAASELQAAQEKFDWASRIFQERQNSIPIACEVPVIIDQRLYEMAQAILGQMKE